MRQMAAVVVMVLRRLAIVIPIIDNVDGKDTTVRGTINTSPEPSLSFQ
jgi:hypothetical protein